MTANTVPVTASTRIIMMRIRATVSITVVGRPSYGISLSIMNNK